VVAVFAFGAPVAAARPATTGTLPTHKANGMTVLSMWAIRRDNRGCPGDPGQNDCSGIVQNAWDFTHSLAPYTGPQGSE